MIVMCTAAVPIELLPAGIHSLQATSSAPDAFAALMDGALAADLAPAKAPGIAPLVPNLENADVPSGDNDQQDLSDAMAAALAVCSAVQLSPALPSPCATSDEITLVTRESGDRAGTGAASSSAAQLGNTIYADTQATWAKPADIAEEFEPLEIVPSEKRTSSDEPGESASAATGPQTSMIRTTPPKECSSPAAVRDASSAMTITETDAAMISDHAALGRLQEPQTTDAQNVSLMAVPITSTCEQPAASHRPATSSAKPFRVTDGFQTAGSHSAPSNQTAPESHLGSRVTQIKSIASPATIDRERAEPEESTTVFKSSEHVAASVLTSAPPSITTRGNLPDTEVRSAESSPMPQTAGVEPPAAETQQSRGNELRIRVDGGGWHNMEVRATLNHHGVTANFTAAGGDHETLTSLLPELQRHLQQRDVAVYSLSLQHSSMGTGSHDERRAPQSQPNPIVLREQDALRPTLSDFAISQSDPNRLSILA